MKPEIPAEIVAVMHPEMVLQLHSYQFGGTINLSFPSRAAAEPMFNLLHAAWIEANAPKGAR